MAKKIIDHRITGRVNEKKDSRQNFPAGIFFFRICAKIKKSKDKFGFETEDKSLAAHFEHMIAVMENGAENIDKNVI